MIRARQTCFCGELRAATIASSRALSEAVTEMLIPVRIPHCRTQQHWRESPTGLVRSDQSTRYVYFTVAAAQALLHYLGALAIIFGVIGYAFGTFDHRRDLLVGGIGCLVLKHVIRAIYSYSLRVAQNEGPPYR
jgi:hypothetical protein